MADPADRSAAELRRRRRLGDPARARYPARTTLDKGVLMALTVRRITLWRADVANEPGALARALEPLAAAGASLSQVMGFRIPDAPERSAIEVFPVSGRRAERAAAEGGLRPFPIPAVLLEGDDRVGLGARLARGLADEGINIAFLVAATVGRRFVATIGFADERIVKRAMQRLRAVGREVERTGRTSARKTPAQTTRSAPASRGRTRRAGT
jgi:hypothetical protein